MAVAVLTPIVLTMDTVSADLPDASGTAATEVGTAVTGGWTCDVTSYKANRILFKFLADGNGDTVVINAGDYPPAARQGLGSLTSVLAASDVKYVCVESARFMQSDGIMTLYPLAQVGTLAWCFILPLAV